MYENNIWIGIKWRRSWLFIQQLMPIALRTVGSYHSPMAIELSRLDPYENYLTKILIYLNRMISP